jgi:fimbrial chaperone protein
MASFLLFFALSIFAISQHADAFVFAPMSVSLTASGIGSSHSFQLTNDSETTIAVEIYMTRRQMDLDGQEKFERDPDTNKIFMVYPSHVVMKPNEKRSIRIAWAGRTSLKSELSYRIIAEQLPVHTEKRKRNQARGTINLLLKYVGAVYVTPKDGASDVVVRKAAIAPENPSHLNLLLENIGTAHQVLTLMKLHFTSSLNSKTMTLNAESLQGFAGQNILAGASRRFSIPWPEGLPRGPIQVKCEFTY